MITVIDIRISDNAGQLFLSILFEDIKHSLSQFLALSVAVKMHLHSKIQFAAF